MLFYNQRLELASRFEKWCEVNRVLRCPKSMVAFLQVKGLFDERKVVEYLATKDDVTDNLSGLQEFDI
jgi:hypothetical protein